MSIPEYQITDIDWWEKDALLIISGRKIYFQFSEEPTLLECIEFLQREAKQNE